MSNEEPKGYVNVSIAENKADIKINGIIGWDVWDTDVMWMLDQLKDVEEINIDLDSLGGSVMDGLTIHNLLKGHKAKVNINIIGKAVSMGSGIAAAGDHVTMMQSGVYMLHNPWSFVAGEEKDLQKGINVLKTLKSTLVTNYVNKSGLSRTVISNMMDEETWLTPQQALKHGFIDEVIEISPDIAAHYIPDNLNFNNVPAFAQDLIKKETQNMSTETPKEDVKVPATQETTAVNTAAPEQPKKTEEAVKVDAVVNRCPADVQNIADMSSSIVNLTEKNNTLQETVAAKDLVIVNLTAEKDKAVNTMVKAQTLANKIGVNLADVEEEPTDNGDSPRDIWKNMPNDSDGEKLARAAFWNANVKKKK